MPFICFLFLNLCSVAPRSSRGGFSSQRMGNFCRSIKKFSFWIHALWMKHEDTAFDWGNYIVQLTKTIFKVFVRLFNNYSCANQLAVESFFGSAQIFFSWKGRGHMGGGWSLNSIRDTPSFNSRNRKTISNHEYENRTLPPQNWNPPSSTSAAPSLSFNLKTPTIWNCLIKPENNNVCDVKLS